VIQALASLGAMETQWGPRLAERGWRVPGWSWEASGPAWCWCEKGQHTPRATMELGREAEPAAAEGQRAVGQGGDGGTWRGRCVPGSSCAWLHSQPHACAPRSPHRALTHSRDLREEQEKIISGVERQIQGKGLEKLNQALASKGEC